MDDPLRQEVFVNLHTVVRQGLRAGVASCSLKEVEALARFAREGGGDAHAKRSALWTVGGSSCRLGVRFMGHSTGDDDRN